MLNLKDFTQDLKSLVAINSVFSTPKKDMPFGEGPALALNVFLQIASRLGFKTINYNNYIGELSVGSGEEVGIIGHVDIVPAGDGWLTDPFVLTEKEGVLYGRGTSDDKGPLLACLYALKSVVDSGIKFNRKIKFYVGTNEESGWDDIEYFKKNNGFPLYGFSPDGCFPVIYAEKGMYKATFYLPKLKHFSNIKGGTAINAVCDRCECKPLDNISSTELSALAQKFGLIIDKGTIISNGVSAHGSRPNLGKNAILPLMQFFKACGEDVQKIIDCFFNDVHGIFEMENEQGDVTISPDLIWEDEKGICLACDLRIPAPFTLSEVTKKLDCFGFEYNVEELQPPMLSNKDGWFVCALLDAYNSTTKENALPKSMCGSTFARAFKHGCAFGGSFPNMPSVAHIPNENVSIQEYINMYNIYKQAIINIVR